MRTIAVDSARVRHPSTNAVEPDPEANVAQLDDFDEIIDVRSPAEFALDHVPGARNCPVLDDAERAQVGTLYKQVSPFAARRVGAALVARNIARHLETGFGDRPRNWRPLIYCWRGGGRSDAMREVLARVGWRTARLRGGYQAYRRAVIELLETLPGELRFRAICGRTGSGKSRVLQALAAAGAQVLDLEQLASHRGSVLGEVPGALQPPQKMFESRLWASLRGLDPSRPVFVEAESRKIGNVQVPGGLITAIRAAACLVLDTPMHVRIALLLDEYRHFLGDADALAERLHALTMHYGRETIRLWIAKAQAGQHAELVAELLARHYDPAYDRSIRHNFAGYAHASVIMLDAAGPAAIADAAQRMIQACATGMDQSN